MSRHRNVRNYDYNDDMAEDIYGHSVEDHELCMSPSTAQFMFNRNNEEEKKHFFGNYMDSRFGSVEEEKEEEEEQSEEEDHLSHSHDYTRPQLDPVSQAKLSSCLDHLQSILGDDCHEPTAVEAIIKFNFDAEKALDYIFNKESDKTSNKQSKKTDSNLCSSMPDKLTPSVSSEGMTKPSQGINPITTNSLMSLPLSSLVQQEQSIKKLTTTFSQDTQNNNSPELSYNPLLEMLPTSERKNKVNSTFDNELMSVSLSSLTSSDVPDSSKTNKLVKISKQDHSKDGLVSQGRNLTDSQITTLLSSIDNTDGIKGAAYSMDNSQFSTSLASLVNPCSVSQSAQGNKVLTESSLMETSLSSLAGGNMNESSLSSMLQVSSPSMISTLCSGPLETTSLSSLARENAQSDLSRQSCYPPYGELMVSSLSNLASVNAEKPLHGRPYINTNTKAHEELTVLSLANDNTGKSLGLSFERNANSQENLMATSLSSLASLDASEQGSNLANTFGGYLQSQPTLGEKSVVDALRSSQDMLFQHSHSIPLSKQQQVPNQELLETSLASLTLFSKGKEDSSHMLSTARPKPKSLRADRSTLKSPNSKTAKPRKKMDVGKKGPGLSKASTTKFKSKYKISPSMFGMTLCHRINRKSAAVLKRFSSFERSYENTRNIKPFDFLAPSPDDVIFVKQKQGFAHLKH